MSIKIYTKKEIEEFSSSYDLKLPKQTLKQQRKQVLKKSGIIKIKKLSRIQRYALQISNDLPKSEQWFQSLWPFKDLFNKVLGKRIPDVMNNTYKYIIEVDGCFHDSSKQQKIDKIKDKYYQDKGYTVFRVIAYDLKSYNQVLKEVIKLRENQDK